MPCFVLISGNICDDGWSHNKGNCFKIFKMDEKIRWITAEEHCVNKDGHLASIRDQREMRFVHQLLVSDKALIDTYIGEIFSYLLYYTSFFNQRRYSEFWGICHPQIFST